MVSVTHGYPIPALVIGSIILLIAGIGFSGSLSHTPWHDKYEVVKNTLLTILCTYLSSTVLAIVAFGMEPPLEGSEWFSGCPFWLGELGLCAIAFLISKGISHVVRKADRRRKEREEKEKSVPPEN